MVLALVFLQLLVFEFEPFSCQVRHIFHCLELVLGFHSVPNHEIFYHCPTGSIEKKCNVGILNRLDQWFGFGIGFSTENVPFRDLFVESELWTGLPKDYPNANQSDNNQKSGTVKKLWNSERFWKNNVIDHNKILNDLQWPHKIISYDTSLIWPTDPRTRTTVIEPSGPQIPGLTRLLSFLSTGGFPLSLKDKFHSTWIRYFEL